MDSSIDKTYDVIIIGCGAAGIGAGLEFQKFEFIPNFLILEARNRVGGRTYTDKHSFNSIEPIDIGARWIHHYGSENPLAVYHTPSDKDVIDYEFYERSTTAFFDIDGTLISNTLIDESENFVKDLCRDIEHYPSDKEDASLLDVIRDKYERIQDEKLRRAVDINLACMELYEASNLDQLSAKSHLKADSNAAMCNLALPIGLGSFMEQIVERNKLPFELNTIVTSIDIPHDRRDPIHITTQDDRHYFTKYLLVTIPLGSLKACSIKFSPPLPDWKQNAIDKMGMGLLNKVFIQFPFTFWDETLQIIFTTSNRFRLFFCFPRDQMLILFAVGNVARQLEKEPDEDIIEQVLQSLKTIYPQVPKPTKWLITRWGCDPFAYGSYSNIIVGATYETTKALAKECYDDRVYWAGEHANYGGTIGCVESAFESGQREAKRIYEKLNRTHI